jgi:hypothetical protein
MKRSFKSALAALLLITLCSVFITASADADPEALQIADIEISLNADIPTLNVTLNNTGTASIDEFALALAFLDEDDYRLFGFPDTPDGYVDEVCNWYYIPAEPIAAGGSFLTEDVFSDYSGTSTIAVAIRYYHITDGDYIRFPESEWQWFFPGDEMDSRMANREYYRQPSDSIYDSIGDFSLGYNYSLLDDYSASYYDKNQGGEWITSVEADSPAALAGLQVGDLILFVDSVKPTENNYAVEYAMSAIMNGEKVDWVFERDNLIYVTRVEKP